MIGSHHAKRETVDNSATNLWSRKKYRVSASLPSEQEIDSLSVNQDLVNALARVFWAHKSPSITL